ncbi:dimethylsulfonioproprionate lyase family protein [Terrimonas pollutisoli]|uniref:dimethylsulfonioproprionate lyase family protein n=1 Tax=Terrimonas pollutisoli TaxID=3034147 RepID=UPI0023EDFCE0|nr:cupin domain-containing protein [Terrimonas sp. H1YJ31]
MNTSIIDYITKTSLIEWQPLVENGVDTNGIYVKILRFDEQQKRPPSILLKFGPGAKYPYHNHPGGEELFVLSGTCRVNETELNAGDYLYTPPGFKHSVQSDPGCELMLIIPEEVEIAGTEVTNE